MQKDYAVHTFELQGLLDDLGIHIQVEKVAQVKRVGQTDHRGAEVLLDLGEELGEQAKYAGKTAFKIAR